jgi:hypothetical protein
MNEFVAEVCIVSISTISIHFAKQNQNKEGKTRKKNKEK